MHSLSTHSEFLRLRVQGLSLSSIARRLGISKPTLIAWNRQAQPGIHAAILNDRQRRDSELAASANQQLADLTRRLTAVRQELFSRALRNIPTPDLETLAGELRQRIRQLESKSGVAQSSPTAPSNAEAPSGPALSALSTPHSALSMDSTAPSISSDPTVPPGAPSDLGSPSLIEIQNSKMSNAFSSGSPHSSLRIPHPSGPSESIRTYPNPKNLISPSHARSNR